MLILTHLNVGDVYAADSDIVCDSNSCSGLDGAIFAEQGILPGDLVNRSVSITNNGVEDLQIEYELSADPGSEDSFTQKVEAVVSKDSVDVYDGNLSGLFGIKRKLGSLQQGNDMLIEFGLLLPEDAGNEFQNNTAKFDIAFYITGETSGETEVLGTNNESSSNDDNDQNGSSADDGSVLGESDEDESLMGKILGLSDTSSGRRGMSLLMVGAATFLIGLYFLVTDFFEKEKE